MKKSIFLLIMMMVHSCALGVMIDLKDALDYAKNQGVSQRDLPNVEKLFKQYVKENQIDDIKMVEVVSGFLAQKNNFKETFEKKIEQLKQLEKEAQQLEKQKKDPITKIQEKARLFDQLEKELQKKSASRWFYSGDILQYIIKLKEFNVIDTPYGNGFAIPAQLKSKLKNPLIHLLSHQQIYSTCGFHVLANAYALQKQVEANKKISMKETQKIAEQFFTDFLTKQAAFTQCQVGEKFEEPEFGDIQKVVDTNKSTFGKDFDIRIIHSSYVSPESKKIMTQALRTHHIVHFIFHTGGHFDLASVVHTDEKYEIFFLNSTNSALTQTEIDYLLLVDQLIEQAKKMPEQKHKEQKPQFSSEAKQLLINKALVFLKQNNNEQVIADVIDQNIVWKDILGDEQKIQNFLRLLFTNKIPQAIKILEDKKQ